MPFIPGESLRQRLERERQLPLDDAVRIARDVAAALDYAHRQQIVHRDIKPENVMLHDGEAVVTDFGIAKAVTAAAADSLTQTGTSIGTPAYMSPEQAGGEAELDGRSDIYSLGAVLYEMVAGSAPFTGPTLQSIITKLFTDTARPIREVRADTPEWLESAVFRCLEKPAEARYATASLLAQALTWPAGTSTPPGMPASSTGGKSIAVLPFVNMSADAENEYFSDGIAEEIINALAQDPGVAGGASAPPRSLSKGRARTFGAIGRKLKVATILEGSVRKAGNKLRVTAQLINVADGYQLWSERYDRQLEDVFAIQDEIARAIVDALKLHLGSDTEKLVVPAKNLEAYNLYLKARFFYHRFTEASLQKSLDFYQRVLLLEPGYGRAYAGMADCWCRLADDWMAPDDAYPMAKTAATKALQHDDNLAEALTSLGKVLGWYEWDFSGAEQQLRRAVSLNPNDAEAHWAFGSVLPTVGLLGEAIAEIRKALALDPLDPGYSRWLARYLLYAGDYSAAIAQGEKIIELGEDFFLAYLDVGSAHLAQGNAEEALKWYRRGQALENSVRSYDAFIVRALAALDRRDEADEILARLEEESREHYVRAEILAMGYAALGDADRAFACLERAFQSRSGGLIYLHIEPGYKALRDDPRFADLVRRIGLR